VSLEETIAEVVRRVVREELAAANRAAGPEKDWLSTEEAAALRSVAPKTIRAWTKIGLYSEKRRRRVYVKRADVLAFRGPDDSAEAKVFARLRRVS
jgi:hypothetical protein